MKYLLYFCSLTIVIGLISCTSNNQQPQNSTASATPSGMMKVLTKDQFNKKLAAVPNAQLVDVRTPEEVAEGAIPNAINLDFYSADFDQRIKTLDKNRPVFVYCKSGGRSGKTAKKLNAARYKEVYDLKGGFSNWSE